MRRSIILTGLALSILAAGLTWADIPQHEREALVAFYISTGGEDWHNDRHWLDEPGTECEWYGVHCDGEVGSEFVATVDLGNNNLRG